MVIVPRTATPFAQVAFPGLIEDAFRAENIPLRGMQRMMLAVLAALETGRGASMKNNNLGNITAGTSYQGLAWRPPWFDAAEAAGNPRHEHLHREMLAGRAPSAFRAYEGIHDGARDFARVLARNFPEVLRASLVPNAETFRAALAQKYSRDYANPAATASIAKLMSEFSIQPTASSGPGLLMALAVAWLAWRFWR